MIVLVINIQVFGKIEKYEGQWEDGKRKGQGTLFSRKGKILEKGIWNNDKFVKAAGAKE